MEFFVYVFCCPQFVVSLSLSLPLSLSLSMYTCMYTYICMHMHSYVSKIALRDVHGNDVAARLQCTGVLRSHMLIISHPFARNSIINGDTGGVGFFDQQETFCEWE